MRRLLITPFLAVTVFAQSVPFIPYIPLSAWHLNAGTTLEHAPDGSQVIQLGYGSSAYVDLTTTPAQLQKLPASPYVIEGVYRLKFAEQNALQVYPSYYRFEVKFGTQEVCPAEGWGTEALNNITVECPMPGYIVVNHSIFCEQDPCTTGPPQGDANFVISVSDGGWPVWIKDVSLTFTPTN